MLVLEILITAVLIKGIEILSSLPLPSLLSLLIELHPFQNKTNQQESQDLGLTNK
jgi:hypothetical protein